jgi:diacylglycerol kinase family enzyme
LKALILINNVDRSHCTSGQIRKIEDLFSSRDIPYRLVQFKSSRESVNAFNRSLSEGFDTLFMGGGDGTIHHLYNMAHGKGMKFGVIPLGTINALARSLRIPFNPVKACKAAIDGREIPMDVGKVAGRLFTCFASVGFDASVVHTINESAKIKWKRGAFAIQGFRRLWRLDEIHPFEIIVNKFDKSLQGYSMIVSNIRNYAGFNFFRDKPGNGKMELVLFRKNRIYDYLVTIGKMFGKKNDSENDGSSWYYRSEFERLVIKCPEKIFLQLDGEPVETKRGEELNFEILPKAAVFLGPE